MIQPVSIALVIMYVSVLSCHLKDNETECTQEQEFNGECERNINKIDYCLTTHDNEIVGRISIGLDEIEKYKKKVIENVN